MKKSFLSVIMSVYNGDKYLLEAMRSVLNQTYDNFEFIIINDGSTDNSLSIINDYIKIDKRIILINRENKGLPYSLNEGIIKAKGDYIVRMDSDDICLLDRFDVQLKYMKKNNLDVCGSYIKVFNEQSNKSIIRQMPITHIDIKVNLLFSSSLAHPTVMFKKEVFYKVKYNTEYKVSQDYQLWTDIIKQDFIIGNLPVVLLNYREHELQASIEKSKLQQEYANRIALNYAKILGKEEERIVKKFINSKNSINYKNFKQLIEDVIIFLKNKNVSQDTVQAIIKKIYIESTPKSPFKYFIYFKNKNKKYLKEEFNLFISSFLILNRNSKLYSYLKLVKNKIKG